MYGPVAGACYWNAMEELDHQRRTGGRDVVYVEGWAVRERDGTFEPFEHGWLEVNGQVHDVTPENNCLAYLAGLRFADPGREVAELGVEIPFYRSLVYPPSEGYPNPHYDGGRALEYAAAKRRAVAYCQDYKEQWAKLLDMVDDIRAFLRENEARRKSKS
jgi:hypothetical protein